MNTPVDWSVPVRLFDGTRLVPYPYKQSPDDQGDRYLIREDNKLFTDDQRKFGLATVLIVRPDGSQWCGDDTQIVFNRCIPAFPRDVKVPPAPMRGLPADAQPGHEEGEMCLRTYGDHTCLGTLELQPGIDVKDHGCLCFKFGPCPYCMSRVPECPSCGWRAEEPE